MASNSQKLQTILEAAGINTRRVLVLGAYAHVDTFEKYETPLTDIMGAAGFGKIAANGGRHMDGLDGFRVVFKLAA